MKHARPIVLYAAAVRDATGVNARPGAVLVQDGKVIAAGEPASLPAELVEQAEVLDRRNCLLLPAMVNAHTHLELTSIGPQPYDPAGGFVGWVKMVRARCATEVFSTTESARHGAECAKASGVQAVGDIASDDIHADIRRSVGLAGVTYLELFGLGSPYDEPALELIQRSSEGLQPHAPYSAGRAVYQAATFADRPVATHLAETKEEAAFVGQANGPLIDYAKSLDRWRDVFADDYRQSHTPVLWMRRYLDEIAHEGGWLLAHCNYLSDLDIQVLADGEASVAYCPIASEYFGHKDHRYRDMIAAGVNVCLGTDSIVGTDPNDLQPLGLLSAMRRLHQRDLADPDTLLA
ncbi:MAG: amidohydrolase family protein, partial [Phycisphaeraceae bacterium]